MNEEALISAIQNQQLAEIQFRKETDQNWVVREVAPYDIYDRRDKYGHSRRALLGYCWKHKDYKEAPILIYLDTIDYVKLLDKNFNGSEVRRLINPKELPNIPRNW